MYVYTAGNPLVPCLQFAPGTLFVPRSNAPAQLDVASMQYVVHNNDADQQMHGQPLSHQYMPNDSMLFQHYADMDMAQPGGVRNLLQAETHGTPTANYGMDRGVAGKTHLHVLKLCVCVCEACAVPEGMSPLMCVVGSWIVNAEVADEEKSLM